MRKEREAKSKEEGINGRTRGKEKERGNAGIEMTCSISALHIMNFTSEISYSFHFEIASFLNYF